MADVVFLARTAWLGAGEPVTDAAIGVVGGRIAAVGPRDEVLHDLPAGLAEVDLGDTFVMPGLIDAHVHLHFPSRGPGDVPLSLVEPIEFSALRAAHNAEAYLVSGVTTVMDCGTRGSIAVALREAIERGLCRGPRVVAAGPIISPTGGLADEEATFIHNEHPGGVTADTPRELSRAVRRQIKQGVDVIKLGVSGSALNPHSDPGALDMTEADIALVADIAHRSGVRVAAHTQTREGALAAIRGGADIVHHGYGMDRECLDEIARRGTFFVPTAMKLRALIEDGAELGRPAAALKVFEGRYTEFMQLLRECVAAGLEEQMATGSDAGNLPPAHGTTARELLVFEEAGMSRGGALRAITANAAAAAGRDDVGLLEPGRHADLIALDGNPLADLAVLGDRQRIQAVVKGGDVVARRGVIEDAAYEHPPLRGELWRARRIGRAAARRIHSA